MTTPANITVVPADLSDGEKAILRRLEKTPIELYWGRSGWVPDSLPKPAKRADFDRICKRSPAMVEISRARLVLATDTTNRENRPLRLIR